MWWALLLAPLLLAAAIRAVRTPLERRRGGTDPCRFRRRFLAALALLSVNAVGFYGFHGLVLALAVTFASWELYRPTFRDTPAVLAVLTLLGGAVHLVNLLLRATVYPQASYFYTCGLEGNPVLDWLLALIPVYFLYELPLLLLMVLFCGAITLLWQLGRRLLSAGASAL